MLTSEQFDRARRLAFRLTGIELVERHREPLERKSRSDEDLVALFDSVESGDAAAARRLISIFTTRHTGLFRHPEQFDLAAEHALWAAHRRGSARLWSAAAATGEEPYSLAMTLLEVFRRDDPPATILATDVDAEALATARRAEYPGAALETLPAMSRARVRAEPAAANRWRVAAPARSLVEFRELNLASAAWTVEAPFDVVFCRNVLMYLEPDLRYAVLERLASVLRRGGLLLLDPAEHLGRASGLFVRKAPGAYYRPGPG